MTFFAVKRRLYRPLQFSLRTLLFLVTLMAVWLGREVERARRQKQIADAVRSGVDARWESGGLVRYQGGRSATSRGSLYDWMARALGRDFVDTIEFVNLRPCYMEEIRTPMGHAPAGLDELAGLRSLDVEGTDFDDDYLARLTNLDKLAELDLRHTRVTPSAVASFQRAVPGCKVHW